MSRLQQYLEMSIALRSSKALIRNLIWAKKHIDELEILTIRHNSDDPEYMDEYEKPMIAEYRKRWNDIQDMIKNSSKPYQYVYNQIRNLSGEVSSQYYNYEGDD